MFFIPSEIYLTLNRITFTSLPNDKILEYTKLKAPAKNRIKCDSKIDFFFIRVEICSEKEKY